MSQFQRDWKIGMTLSSLKIIKIIWSEWVVHVGILTLSDTMQPFLQAMVFYSNYNKYGFDLIWGLTINFPRTNVL